MQTPAFQRLVRRTGCKCTKLGSEGQGALLNAAIKYLEILFNKFEY